MKSKEIINRTYNDKKAAVTAAAGKHRWAIPMVLAVLVAAAAAGAAFYLTRSPDAVQASPDKSEPGAGSDSNNVVSYPLEDFDNGKARFYKYDHNGIAIKYFVLKSSDGVIRAAFDACDVCWRAGKGYAQQGDHMVCRNCNRRFASVMVNEVEGGCNPAPLRRTIRDDRLVIRVEDIVPGRQYFNFN